MKWKSLILVFFVSLLIPGICFSQNIEATKQFLEIQLEILELQATIDAMQNQGGGVTLSESFALKTGDTFTFGRYEQDNDLKNGPEPIEWNVLGVENDHALVISKYALETKPYNEIRNPVTWETSSIRRWLNNDFFNSAFNSSEQDKIQLVTLRNEDNSMSGTKGGNDTSDHIFLLSFYESEKYFLNSFVKKCKPTAYAKAKGAYVNEIFEDGTTIWWLRTPGYGSDHVSNINTSGIPEDYFGEFVDSSVITVRPAFWIKQ